MSKTVFLGSDKKIAKKLVSHMINRGWVLDTEPVGTSGTQYVVDTKSYNDRAQQFACDFLAGASAALGE